MSSSPPPTSAPPSQPPAPSSRPQSIADPARRARIRATVGRAAQTLAPTWPLERFVATNPLLQVEDRPLEDAAVEAAQLLRARTEIDETTFRSWLAQGRISDEDLDAAIADHLRDAGPAGRKVDGIAGSTEALRRARAELVNAPVVDSPSPRPVLLSEWHDLATGSTWATDIDDYAAWWCAARLGEHVAWTLPARADGLYPAWRRVAGRDRRLAGWVGSELGSRVTSLPERPDDAVLALLVELGVDRPDHPEYLQRHLARHPGWTAALVRAGGVDGDDVVGLLAIRLAAEAMIFSDPGRRSRARRTAAAESDRATDVAPTPGRLLSTPERLAIWREAYERSYRDTLLGQISPSGFDSDDGSDSLEAGRPEVQAVFCIDPRSEGLRRHLEAIGGHETIGFAGFFGLPIKVRDLDTSGSVPSCPVILDAAAEVVESPVDRAAERHRHAHGLAHAAHNTFATTKRSTAAPFVLAEATGWWSGPWSAARTLAPRTADSIASSMRARFALDVDTRIDSVVSTWWTEPEQVAVAAAILRLTGLDTHPARLVLLCGHGSHHLNNLHRAALDCGACGGRPGGTNARVAVALLNDPRVRDALAADGTPIPTDTWFVAGEHDTTTDEVRIFDPDSVPASHQGLLATLTADLEFAGGQLAEERGRVLPATVGRRVGPRRSAVRRRAHDWAQVVPEWGLAGNAALVIAPRSVTSRVDLGRRVFLHSYDAGRDHDGRSLAAILSGPLLVAHWISSQYRYSATDPSRFGAGNKPTHNLIGGAGVIDGAGGDLRLGLPAESLGAPGLAGHEPMRLLVVIDAPTTRVDRLLAELPAVDRLVTNGWIRLVAADHDGRSRSWSLRQRDGGWTPARSEPGRASEPAVVPVHAQHVHREVVV